MTSSSSNGFPFDVQTRPHATVEVEISEDMQLVHFDFNRYFHTHALKIS